MYISLMPLLWLEKVNTFSLLSPCTAFCRFLFGFLLHSSNLSSFFIIFVGIALTQSEHKTRIHYLPLKGCPIGHPLFITVINLRS